LMIKTGLEHLQAQFKGIGFRFDNQLAPAAPAAPVKRT
jgi:hypothetical protein